jgi:hypothetical protein
VVQAECVFGAKHKTEYRILGAHTILLSGGPGRNIIITSYSFFNSHSSVEVLKDSFCDYENAVLYVDDEPVDVKTVSWAD